MADYKRDQRIVFKSGSHYYLGTIISTKDGYKVDPDVPDMEPVVLSKNTNNILGITAAGTRTKPILTVEEAKRYILQLVQPIKVPVIKHWIWKAGDRILTKTDTGIRLGTIQDIGTYGLRILLDNGKTTQVQAFGKHIFGRGKATKMGSTIAEKNVGQYRTRATSSLVEPIPVDTNPIESESSSLLELAYPGPDEVDVSQEYVDESLRLEANKLDKSVYGSRACIWVDQFVLLGGQSFGRLESLYSIYDAPALSMDQNNHEDHRIGNAVVVENGDGSTKTVSALTILPNKMDQGYKLIQNLLPMLTLPLTIAIPHQNLPLYEDVVGVSIVDERGDKIKKPMSYKGQLHIQFKAAGTK